MIKLTHLFLMLTLFFMFSCNVKESIGTPISEEIPTIDFEYVEPNPKDLGSHTAVHLVAKRSKVCVSRIERIEGTTALNLREEGLKVLVFIGKNQLRKFFIADLNYPEEGETAEFTVFIDNEFIFDRIVLNGFLTNNQDREIHVTNSDIFLLEENRGKDLGVNKKRDDF